MRLRNSVLAVLSYIWFVIKSYFFITKHKDLSLNKWVLEKFKYVQKRLDSINRMSDNLQTDILMEVINENEKVFKGFTAKFVANKHGRGNHGMELNYDNTIGSTKLSLGIGTNGTDPEVSFKIGL